MLHYSEVHIQIEALSAAVSSQGQQMLWASAFS